MSSEKKLTTGNSARKPVKNAKRKAILARITALIVLIFVILLAILGILAIIRGCVKKTAPKVTSAPVESAPDLAPNDAYENIFEDADYLREDRSIHYQIEEGTRATSFVLDEYEESELNEGARFFVRYFDTVIGGDYDTYHTFFSDVYRENDDGYKNFEDKPFSRVFPMQRVYDIHVKQLARTKEGDEAYKYNGEKVVYGVYEVSYKILKNGGDFRVDLKQGGSVPLIFELMTIGAGTDDERTYINGIYRYADIPSSD